jgi:hypothetical protein
MTIYVTALIGIDAITLTLSVGYIMVGRFIQGVSAEKRAAQGTEK